MGTRVTDKQIMCDMWLRMAFGNRPTVWMGLDAWWEAYKQAIDGYRSRVGLRYREVDSRRKANNVGPWDIQNTLDRLGGDPENYIITEQLPEDDAVLRCELTTCVEGLYLLWATGPAMARLRGELGPTCKGVGGPAIATGMEALGMLKMYLDPADRADLADLVKEYPDHTIEFSVYRRRVGVCRRRMVVWEVRAY